MYDLLNNPHFRKDQIRTVESHGKTYRVFDGTCYAEGTPDDLILVLHSARVFKHRIRVHYGYTTQKAADEAGLGGVVGRDWLEEHDVEGTIGRSMGPVKIPLLIPTVRSSGGPGLLTDCIVKITTTGKDRRTRYQHADYHTPQLTLAPCNRTPRDDVAPDYKMEVRANGVVHARFESSARAKRWIARMGLAYGT